MATKKRRALHAVALLLCMQTGHAALQCSCPFQLATGAGKKQVSRYWELWCQLGCTLRLHGPAEDASVESSRMSRGGRQRRSLADATEEPPSKEKSQGPNEKFEGLDNEEHVQIALEDMKERDAAKMNSGLEPAVPVERNPIIRDAYTALESVVASTNMTEQHVAALAELPEPETPPDSKGQGHSRVAWYNRRSPPPVEQSFMPASNGAFSLGPGGASSDIVSNSTAPLNEEEVNDLEDELFSLEMGQEVGPKDDPDADEEYDATGDENITMYTVADDDDESADGKPSDNPSGKSTKTGKTGAIPPPRLAKHPTRKLPPGVWDPTHWRRQKHCIIGASGGGPGRGGRKGEKGAGGEVSGPGAAAAQKLCNPYRAPGPFVKLWDMSHPEVLTVARKMAKDGDGIVSSDDVKELVRLARRHNVTRVPNMFMDDYAGTVAYTNSKTPADDGLIWILIDRVPAASKANGCGGLLWGLRPNSTDMRSLITQFVNCEHAFLLEMPHVQPKYILDAGGPGMAAVWFAAVYPKATVIRAEPYAGSFKAGTANSEAFPNIKQVQKGLWDEEGSSQLCEDTRADWGTKWPLKGSGTQGYYTKPLGDSLCQLVSDGGISVTMLPRLMEEVGVPHLDIIKLDIGETAQKRVLKQEAVAEVLRKTEVFIGELQGKGSGGTSADLLETTFDTLQGFHHVHYEDNEIFIQDKLGACKDGPKPPREGVRRLTHDEKAGGKSALHNSGDAMHHVQGT